MQNMNYKETNGILIGSEFSRIFAELILQKIDKAVLNKLTENKILHKKDYAIFRYVDDYFLFYNEDDVKNLIIQTFNNELQKYKFYLNESKMEEFTKPFVTNITIAKKKIKDLLKEFDFDSNNKYTIDSKDIIVNFKAILKENEIKYNDILNYTLAIIDKKIDFINKDINKYIIIENIINNLNEIKAELILVKLKKNLNNIKKNKIKNIQKDIENIMQTIDIHIQNLKIKKELKFDKEDLAKNINNYKKTIKDLKDSIYEDKEITKYINNSLDELSALKDFFEMYIDMKDSFKKTINEVDELFSFNENGEFDNIKSIIKNNCLKIKDKLFIHLKEMLKFVFFIYSESDKTSATVKLSLILAKLINFMNHNYFDKYLKNKLYKLIFDEIHHLLKKK